MKDDPAISHWHFRKYRSDRRPSSVDWKCVGNPSKEVVPWDAPSLEEVRYAASLAEVQIVVQSLDLDAPGAIRSEFYGRRTSRSDDQTGGRSRLREQKVGRRLNIERLNFHR